MEWREDTPTIYLSLEYPLTLYPSCVKMKPMSSGSGIKRRALEWGRRMTERLVDLKSAFGEVHS